MSTLGGILLVSRVTRVIDGDSFHAQVVGDLPGGLVLTKRGYVKVRVADIDCPELGQPYGSTARIETRGRLAQGSVILEPVTIDRYGRLVAQVYYGPRRRNLAEQLLLWGHAFVYTRYVDPLRRAYFLQLEALARRFRRGVWRRRRGGIVYPWAWRRRGRVRRRRIVDRGKQ